MVEHKIRPRPSSTRRTARRQDKEIGRRIARGRHVPDVVRASAGLAGLIEMEWTQVLCSIECHFSRRYSARGAAAVEEVEASRSSGATNASKMLRCTRWAKNKGDV